MIIIISVEYKEVLPNNIPPSYRGQDIKMNYKVCIGVGRIGKPLTLIRLPFRVIELKGIASKSRH